MFEKSVFYTNSCISGRVKDENGECAYKGLCNRSVIVYQVTCRKQVRNTLVLYSKKIRSEWNSILMTSGCGLGRVSGRIPLPDILVDFLVRSAWLGRLGHYATSTLPGSDRFLWVDFYKREKKDALFCILSKDAQECVLSVSFSPPLKNLK